MVITILYLKKLPFLEEKLVFDNQALDDIIHTVSEKNETKSIEY